REELMHTKEDLRTAIRLGYEKAFSTIIDSNVTNLIACVVLIFTATTEVKGFAMTLTIGIIGTLFTALFVTKVIYSILLDHFGMKHMPMLATTVPAVARMLEPKLDWIGKRWILAALSITLVSGSWVLISIRGVALLDTEFRGGVAATMRTLKSAEDAHGLQLAQKDVEDRIHKLGDAAEQKIKGGENTHDMQVQSLLSDADVLTVGETGTDSQGRLTADGFQIKVAVPDELGKDATTKNVLVDAIAAEFKDDLNIKPALTFDGAGSTSHENYTFPINAPTLGKVINRSDVTESTAKFQGGVAVVLNNISPPISRQDAVDRIKKMRQQPDFNDCNGRDVEVIGMDQGADSTPAKPTYSSMAIMVTDPQLNFLKVDFDRWDQELASREWELVSEALHRPASLDQVSEFSSAVAQTLRANAIVAVTLTLLAILLYIWVRFGSLRYSTGAILALFHDCSIALGALALSQIVSQTVIGKALLLESFQIDLGVVAAILTLIGYSLNDTIVVLDRIRENRGKRRFPTSAMVNKAINDTFSRTLLTSFTIIVSLLIMYVEGGTGIRAFSFCMLVGMIVGTYSSIAIAAPIVYKDETHLEHLGHEPARKP
ncbi:MAG TPA: protein translocase subunit SecF, partial [Phycisphaerales bacterium]|nr:protein translocase subunit SecF [Phycisphaerales bacterium]